jgi:site-specific DNA-methyltransferase (adenine-specific)
MTEESNIEAQKPLLHKADVSRSAVFNEDCMTIMKRYPDKFFDLAVVDVPYGIGESKKQRSVGTKGDERWKGRATNWTDYSPKDWDNEAPDKTYFDELIRVSKNQIVWGANHFISKVPYDSPCWLVWDKKNGDSDFADCELAWTSFDKAVRKFDWLWNGFQKQRPEDRIHPTQKPVALYDWIFSRFAKDGDLILDTHLGSGSSRIAAHKAGLNFVGCEIDKEYFEGQEARFKEFIKQLRLW